MNQLPKVSVIFITYNRLVTLKPTLESFLQKTEYPRDKLELIVADDASPPKVQAEIRRMPFNFFCLKTKNVGLGANVNSGLAKASGDYILQIQDDWICLGPGNYLKRAIAALEASPDIGMLILRPHTNRLKLSHEKEFISENEFFLFENKLHEEIRQVGLSAYTDWPHLKKKEFILDIGTYLEGKPMWDAELDYSQRINSQATWRIADCENLNIFEHIGENYSYNWPWKKRVHYLLEKVPGGGCFLKYYKKIKKQLIQK
jgi:glycosyltransferase involved in cell wall biosynthesis